MHDLRHIVGGCGVNNGFSLEVVGKTLGRTTANILQGTSSLFLSSLDSSLGFYS